MKKKLSKDQRILLCREALIEVYEKNGVDLKETMKKFTLSEINSAWRALQGSRINKYN